MQHAHAEICEQLDEGDAVLERQIGVLISEENAEPVGFLGLDDVIRLADNLDDVGIVALHVAPAAEFVEQLQCAFPETEGRRHAGIAARLRLPDHVAVEISALQGIDQHATLL